MALSVTFSKTNKKINSTKQPVASADDIVLSVELKDVTNLFSPSLVITADTFTSGGVLTNPMQYNYCYIPDFERYYFVRSWSWVLGMWECSLEVDVLATFKTEIGKTTAFILRAASQYDADIIDTKYPTTMNESGSLQEQSSFGVTSAWNTDIKNASITQGFYSVSVINSDSSAIGGVSYYAFSASAMAELMNKLFSAPTWMGITDVNISADLQKMLFNPMQYITSIMWIPVGFNTSGQTSINSLPLGWWSLTLTNGFYRLNVANCAIEKTLVCSMIYHPQYNASKRRWVQFSPYTTIALYLPPFGFIPLDTTKLYQSNQLKVKVRVDAITGRGTLLISHNYIIGGTTYDGGLIYTTTSQVGVPVTVAQMAVNWDMLSSASTWIMSAGATLATGDVEQKAKGVANAITSFANDYIIDPIKKLTDSKPANAAAVDRYSSSGRTHTGRSGAFGSDGSYYSSNFGGAWKNKTSGSIDPSSILNTVKNTAADIGSTALAASGTCTSSGSSGGFASLQETPFVQFYFMLIAGVDDTHNGIPLCRSTKISNLTGFILCGNTDDFSANCTPAERQAVCALLEAGFYYE